MNTIKSDAKAQRIILGMLEHCTQEQAAVALGVSTTTIWRCLKKPEYQELYRKARSGAFSHVKGRARFAAPSAVGTVVAVMTDPKATPAAQFLASRVILKHADTFLFEKLKASSELMKTLQEAGMDESEYDLPPVVPEANSTRACNGQGIPGTSGASAAKMKRISLAVVQQGSVSKAAAVCGLSVTTVWRWSQKPEFEQHCREVRDEKYSLAISVLQWAANTAMSTLIRLMHGKDVRIRIRAADLILDLASTDAYEDLQAVIDELEKTESMELMNEENEDEEES
jgi:predicted DNA-binding transcriptional regulator AlpA